MSWGQTPGHVLGEHGDFVRRFVAEQGVQTNEVQRSWMLLPAFLHVARIAAADTLELVELGPSAGLNLVWDGYRYRYANGSWGSDGAPLELTGDERGHVPEELLQLTPRVGSRTGIDISPIDVATEEGARLLKSFVWPDQTWRLDQLERAIEALRRAPPTLRAGDVVVDLPRLLGELPGHGFLVVYATNVLDYIGRTGREVVFETLERLGAERPLALISNSPAANESHTYQSLTLRRFPGGEPITLCNADFHGAWLDWLA
jgi:hypothetical protein